MFSGSKETNKKVNLAQRNKEKLMKTRAEVYERENNGTLEELNKGKSHYLNKNLIEVINSCQN